MRFKTRDHIELLGTDKLEELKEKENLKKESVTSTGSVLVYCSLMRALRARACAIFVGKVRLYALNQCFVV
jgi:hypothetical protein